MNPTLTAGLIYTALAMLYLIAVHGICFRLIHVDRKLKLCPHSLLFQIVHGHYANWSDVVKTWGGRSGPAWLQESLSQSEVHLAESCAEKIGLQSDAYLNVLAVVCSLSTLFGLLGTVSGFLVAGEVSAVGLNVAFRTTFWGILIGIPPAIYLGFTKQKRDRFDRQLDTFQEFCETIARTQNQPEPAMAISLPSSQAVELDVKVVDSAFASTRPSKDHGPMVRPNSQPTGQPVGQRWQEASS